MTACLKLTRSTAKVWARRFRAPPSIIPNCKFLILLFDYFEEHRGLSVHELQVRELCRLKLAEVLKDRAAYWKQRSKHRAIREGDANTAFHHAQATARMRPNRIRHIEIQGTLVANHGAKVEALTAHFRDLLGVSGQSVWNFDVAALYQGSQQASASLVLPFTEDEAKQAISEMNRNSAPGPDGFGPSFYKAAWSVIRSQVLDLLVHFQQGDVDLERINRSYMVLIPKKVGAMTVDSFRPICLQNCSVKLIAKVLTIRLQKEISGLVDSHQTGFLQGRSIAESFVHAAELIQHCWKRKRPSIALKLDFAKAFDTVNWDGLLRIF